MEERMVHLADGRKLGFAVYGPSSGTPVFYFHGTPSSRLELLLLKHFGVDLDSTLADFNFQLIAVDRPGMGLSDYNKNGDFLSFASDVKQLADHLKIVSCPVLCWSGGGPYALAVTFRYPELITSTHIICGFTRKFDEEIMRQMNINKWYFKAAKSTPWLMTRIMNIIRKTKIRSSVPQKLTGLPTVDYKFLQKPEDLRMAATLTMKEAYRAGAEGPIYEAKSYYRDYGFSISDIQQHVHYWWGTADHTVIRLHAEEIEQRVVNHTLHYRTGEGHLSLYINCFREVLQTIRLSEEEIERSV
ncbi:MAG TPA: alpha/beta hydrolase [Chitinophagaceae bacterium]|nr:alpha/beta hydrolase [Chitinophagaceae bacterium]